MDWFHPLIRLVREIGVSGFLDITLIALLLYSMLVWLKRTRRAAFVLTGILIMAGVYLAARQFGLLLTAGLLQGFFAIILVALVVIFQEELRYFFEQVAVWSMKQRLPGSRRQEARLPRRETEILVRTLDDLARAKIGALVVIRGRALIVRHLDGGEDVKGCLSEALLKSIFDPHSMGHDGAVVIDGERIEKLGCHVPLSTNLERLQGKGTRHAAALGLSEVTDALSLVVSEERGEISVARGGEIKRVSTTGELTDVIEGFYQEVCPGPARGRPWRAFVRKNSREKLVALLVAAGLWFVLVKESGTVRKSWDVPVEYSQLPGQLSVAELEPESVHVTLSGPRRTFVLVSDKEVKVSLKLWDAQAGEQRYSISSKDLTIPRGLEVEDIEPRVIRLQLVEKAPGTSN